MKRRSQRYSVIDHDNNDLTGYLIPASELSDLELFKNDLPFNATYPDYLVVVWDE